VKPVLNTDELKEWWLSGTEWLQITLSASQQKPSKGS